jgi:hypothetical protein
MPKIRITRTLKVTTEHEFDKLNYEGATDYTGDTYPEIRNVYEAAAWERQELRDRDVEIEQAVEAAANADNNENLDVTTFIEVVEDEGGPARMTPETVGEVLQRGGYNELSDVVDDTNRKYEDAAHEDAAYDAQR